MKKLQHLRDVVKVLFGGLAVNQDVVDEDLDKGKVPEDACYKSLEYRPAVAKSHRHREPFELAERRAERGFVDRILVDADLPKPSKKIDLGKDF